MKTTIDLTLDCDSATSRPANYDKIRMDIECVDKREVLSHFTAEDVVEHFDLDDLLEAIGIEDVMNYFNLIEKED